MDVQFSHLTKDCLLELKDEIKQLKLILTRFRRGVDSCDKEINIYELCKLEIKKLQDEDKQELISNDKRINLKKLLDSVLEYIIEGESLNDTIDRMSLEEIKQGLNQYITETQNEKFEGSKDLKKKVLDKINITRNFSYNEITDKFTYGIKSIILRYSNNIYEDNLNFDLLLIKDYNECCPYNKITMDDYISIFNKKIYKRDAKYYISQYTFVYNLLHI